MHTLMSKYCDVELYQMSAVASALVLFRWTKCECDFVRCMEADFCDFFFVVVLCPAHRTAATRIYGPNENHFN